MVNRLNFCLLAASVIALSACATPQMHSQAELNNASLSCGLTMAS